MPYGNQNGPSMESAKQEKYDLLHDNPVAKDASGGRPWIAKHFKSSMSPLKDAHSGDSPVEGNAFTKAMADNDGDYEAAKKQLDGISMNYDGVSKKYPAAGHKNLMEDAGAAPKMHTPFHKDDEEMKEAFKQAGEAAGAAGAKVVKKIHKKKNK